MTIDPASLEPGEQLLWSDKPDMKAYCERRPSTGFGLGLTFVALAAAVGVYQFFQGGAVSDARLFIFVLLLLATLFLYLPFRVRHNARRTLYVLTDRRAIIETLGILLYNRVSVRLSEIELVEIHDGRHGDVIFGNYAGHPEHKFQIPREGFFAIANVEEVGRMLRAAIERATGRPVTGSPN
jgi:hypothetical protein